MRSLRQKHLLVLSSSAPFLWIGSLYLGAVLPQHVPEPTLLLYLSLVSEHLDPVLPVLPAVSLLPIQSRAEHLLPFREQPLLPIGYPFCLLPNLLGAP